MSATVTIAQSPARSVEVPNVETYRIDNEGRLHLSRKYSDDVAVFKEWLHVVIYPERDTRGRFVRRSA